MVCREILIFSRVSQMFRNILLLDSLRWVYHVTEDVHVVVGTHCG